MLEVRDGERPARGVEGVVAARLILRALEVGQDVLIGPALIAELAPMVVILGLAANVDEAVDAARAAEHLAARPEDLAVLELGLGLGLVAPVDALVGDRLAVADRDVDPRMRAIIAPRLEHDDGAGRIGREPIGENAAGGAGADDDVICVFYLWHLFSSRTRALYSSPSRRKPGAPLHGPALSAPR